LFVVVTDTKERVGLDFEAKVNLVMQYVSVLNGNSLWPKIFPVLCKFFIYMFYSFIYNKKFWE
jgi:hypothetical protein